MEQSTREWKSAFDLALTAEPEALPNLEDSLGASYLHWSEMQNDMYRGNTDLDISRLYIQTQVCENRPSKLAIEYFQKYLDRKPDDLEVRWLLNLAYMTLGQYPSSVQQNIAFPLKIFSRSRISGAL